MMQEAEEQDTCRICSAPAEPDQPLFHPCKCSGTIRYIHQDCLTTWLAHSKKKTCDVCKHSYSFTKVYASDMPSRLPTFLLLQRFFQQVFWTLVFGIRATLVVGIWLGFLPWITAFTWRMYFFMGHSTALWISNRTMSVSDEPEYPSLLYHSVLRAGPPPPTNAGPFARLFAHPVWLALSSDIFMGQIITMLIVVVFVAVFLLREWISQNARPGIFDDEVVPEDPLPVPEPPPAQPVAAREEAREMPKPNDAPPLDPLEEREFRRRLHRHRMRNDNADPAPIDAFPDPDFKKLAARARKREMEYDTGFDGHVRRNGFATRRMEADGFARRIEAARARNAQLRLVDQKLEEEAEPRERFKFSFAPAVGQSSASTAEGKENNVSAQAAAEAETLTAPNLFDFSLAARPETPFPAVHLDPPSSHIPFSIQNHSGSNTERAPVDFPNIFTPPISAADSPGPSDKPIKFDFSGAASTSSSTTSPLDLQFDSRVGSNAAQEKLPIDKRPPLPNTFSFGGMFSPGGVAKPVPEAGGSGVASTSSPPLPSPTIATYFAPEELAKTPLEAGPSSSANHYFDNDDDFFEEQENEIDKYFVFQSDEEESVGNPELDETEKHQRALQAASDWTAKNKALGKRKAEDYVAELMALADSERENLERDREEQEKNGEVPMPMPPPLVPVKNDDSDEDEYTGEFDDDYDIEEPEEINEDIQPDNFDPENVEPDVDADFEEEDEDPWDDDDDEEEEEVPVLVPQNEAQENDGRNDQEAQRREDDIQDPGEIEDIENNVDDDMEGAMEAVGLRGPIYGVIQNATLMILVLASAIGIGVWMPFTLGKSTALLFLNPPRMLQIIHLPIRIIRILTDPVVDAILRIPVLLYLGLVITITEAFGVFGITFKAKSFEYLAKPFRYLTSSYIQTEEFFKKWTTSTSTAIPKPVVISPPSNFDKMISAAVEYGEPHFAVLGKEVRVGFTEGVNTWERIAVGHGPVERLFAVTFGYLIVAVGLAIYLNMLTVGNMKNAGKAVRSAVRQQLLVIKVATFIFIELVMFPLGCGIVLDVCTIWLFPEGNITTRTAFFMQAPLTAAFYHWLCGTMFMYGFAIMLSGCRSVMRPGAMWFIKDPQDQNSHPIRDILDRPTLTQLRKILVSGVMYAIVVACFVGSVAGLLFVGNKSIMPFCWRNREPLSDVPVDLLFLIFVLPYTVHYLRPRKVVKRLAIAIWKALAARLRLSSYFFGKRDYEEEHTPKRWSLRRLIFGPGHGGPTLVDLENDNVDGSFRRVPAKDSIALPREMRATAAVTEFGIPVDEEARQLLDLQNAEAAKAKRNVAEDYTIVYIPPMFRYRVIAFIASLWVIGAMHLGMLIGAPVLLGRAVFRLFVDHEVHDGYSFLAGFYLLWACYLAGKSMDRLDKRRQRTSGSDDPRAELPFLVVKRAILWLARITYMVFFLGVVIPTLLAIVVDLYVVLPLQFVFEPEFEPKIRIVDSWALGLMFMKIGLHGLRLQPHARRRRRHALGRGLKHLADNGWTHPDPITATKEVIAPVIGGLLGMIVLPAIGLRGVQYLMPFLTIHDKFLYVHVYPSIFAFAGIARSVISAAGALIKWSHVVRDKEFLVEMRLKNHEPEAKAEKPKASKKVKGITPR